MKFLLTSAGIKNESIKQSLIQMLGKPISEASALCIPTAIYALPNGSIHAWGFMKGNGETPMVDLGWKSIGILELTALPSIKQEYWIDLVKQTDVFLVNGGDPLYLAYWMKQSGFAELLPTLDAVYVGLSAGSMVMAPRIGEEFVEWLSPEHNDLTLNLVNFSIFPHLNHVDLPDNTMETAEKWAAKLDAASYAIDDQTAIRVENGEVEIISEGEWRYFNFSSK